MNTWREKEENEEGIGGYDRHSNHNRTDIRARDLGGVVKIEVLQIGNVYVIADYIGFNMFIAKDPIELAAIVSELAFKFKEQGNGNKSE